MPEYIYQNPKDGSIVEVVQKMDEPHVLEVDGVKYDRVFTVAQASINTKLDPFSANQFVESSAKKVGTVGDLFEKSQELSDKRTEKAGQDPLKIAYQQKYKEVRGVEHPEIRKNKAKAALDKLGVIYE